MRGYLQPKSDSSRASTASEEGIEIDDSVLVYRDEDGVASVVAERDGTVIPLDIRDRTVSRRSNDAGEPTYVEFFADDDRIYVRDHGSRNPTTLRDGLGELELEDGTQYPIDQDCTVELGHAAAVTVRLAGSDSEPSGDIWTVVQIRSSDLATYLEVASSDRLEEHATALRDDLAQLNRTADAPAELDACLDGLDEFLGQLRSQRRGSISGEPQTPNDATLEKGRQVTTRISAVVERAV